MTAMRKGVILAVVHVLIVCSLMGKLYYDRATRPRVWVRTVGYDPNLPIRGRYVQMRLELETAELPPPKNSNARELLGWKNVKLEARNGKLFAVASDNYSDMTMQWQPARTDDLVPVLYQPVLFFIPDSAKDPTRLQQGEALWVEVTVPKKGPPRPIQLAVSANGKFTPLNLR
jgi:hypothetical protein